MKTLVLNTPVKNKDGMASYQEIIKADPKLNRIYRVGENRSLILKISLE